jgi:hypothetical protein
MNRRDQGENPDAEFTIERCQGETYKWDGSYAVYRYDTWPESSVNEGLPRRSFIDGSEDLEKLKREHPEATFSESAGAMTPDLPTTAPADFDPTIAGERWDDDY